MLQSKNVQVCNSQIKIIIKQFLGCGQALRRKEPTLIVGGNETQRREYPWQVALYRSSDKELLCGGTLLNQRVILTGSFRL